MKFVIFGDEKRLGALQDGRILDLERAGSARGGASPAAFRSLLALIEEGERGLDLARGVIAEFGGSDDAKLSVDATKVQLHAPFPGRRLAMGGTNYAEHVANAYNNHGKPTTPAEFREKARQGKPGGFWVTSVPVGDRAEIRIPRTADNLFDYEGEVGVVLSKGGKRISADRWKEHVWGTTLINDWSIRPQSLAGGGLPFYGHKVFDGSKSIGPCIVVDEIDPTNCAVETLVNGKVRQSFNSRDMIHTFGEFMQQLSQDLTLLPGDVLSGGTGAGTAFDMTAPKDGSLPLDLFLKAGDEVEVRSPGIGSLRAKILASD